MANYNYSYFDINDDNNSMDRLDAMARELNEKKKKFDLIKAVHNDYYEETKKNKKQLEEALKNDNFGFFKKIKKEGTPIDKLIYDTKKTDQDSVDNNTFKFSSNDSRFSDTYNSNSNSKNKSNKSNNSLSDSFFKNLDKHKKPINKKIVETKNSIESNDNNLSLLINHIKKEHNSHISKDSESINSNSDTSIIKHLKKCSKCKSKIKLVFDDNHNKVINQEINKDNKTFTISISSLKEYLTIGLLIFLIILIIYIFFKLK